MSSTTTNTLKSRSTSDRLHAVFDPFTHLSKGQQLPFAILRLDAARYRLELEFP